MLEVTNLCKSYPTFKLENITFSLPKGYIMGFIGSNGAGKSTTLKSILNIARPDSGSVNVFGKDFTKNEIELKQNIGFMMGAVNYYIRTKIKKLSKIFGSFYKAWNESEFNGYLKRFSLDENKTPLELSAGMQVKLALALALSHDSKLLILDEPTSGLDPIARSELLDLFHEIIEDGEKSILFSTHITSDLDKCADYIIFIRDGKLIANTTKDDLISSHALVSGVKDSLTESLKNRLISHKLSSYGFTGLIQRNQLSAEDKVSIEAPNLEDIMVYYNREGAK